MSNQTLQGLYFIGVLEPGKDPRSAWRGRILNIGGDFAIIELLDWQDDSFSKMLRLVPYSQVCYWELYAEKDAWNFKCATLLAEYDQNTKGINAARQNVAKTRSLLPTVAKRSPSNN